MPDWKIPLFKVGMAPWERIEERLRPILYSGVVAEGAETAQFEKDLAAFLEVPVEHVFCVNSCTSGLTVALKALGVGPGTTVIVPPQTCIATAAPVSNLGAEIIWGDIDPVTGMLDPDSVGERIQENTRAVIPVHWAGDIPDIRGLQHQLQDLRHVGIVEDAAQGFGSRNVDGMQVSSAASDSEFVVYSFQAIKLLTTGDGGVVICNSAARKRIADDLSWFGIDRVTFRKPDGEINWDADVPLVGFKMHMNNITAALGMAQLPWAVKNYLPVHRSNGRALDTMLKEIPEIIVPPREGIPSYWVLSVHAQRRDELVQFLQARGIQASKMHTRLNRYTGFRVARWWPLPGAEAFSRTQVCLPCGWWMDEHHRRYLVESIKAFYSE